MLKLSLPQPHYMVLYQLFLITDHVNHDSRQMELPTKEFYTQMLSQRWRDKERC